MLKSVFALEYFTGKPSVKKFFFIISENRYYLLGGRTEMVFGLS